MAAMSCFQHLNKLVLKNWPGGISPALSDCIKSLVKLEHLEISLGKDRSWERTSTWEDDALYRWVFAKAMCKRSESNGAASGCSRP